MKTALVTGGTSGMGFAIAKRLKKEEFNVFILGRNKENLLSASEEIGCNYLCADLSSPDNIPSFAENFKPDGLDLLVNNAGTYKFTPIGETDLVDIQNIMNTNFVSPFMLASSLLPALKSANGSIINISSAITYSAMPNNSIYAASKGALEAWSRIAAVELAQHNIRVNCICPGIIDTPMINEVKKDPEVMNSVISTIPSGKFGTPEDIAEAVISLFRCKYVTGETLRVDGGVGA